MVSKEIILELSNLHNRPFLHGTSIIKGILDKLKDEYNIITNFNVRIRKQFYNQPILCITDEIDHNKEGMISGDFYHAGNQIYFHLVESENKVLVDTSADIDLFYNEDDFKSRIVETDLGWFMNFSLTDDIHLCYNVISKISNQYLFSIQPGFVFEPNKQTWFVGYHLPKLDFLENNKGVVGVSREYIMLAKTCMKRKLFFNGDLVGDRICVYG